MRAGRGVYGAPSCTLHVHAPPVTSSLLAQPVLEILPRLEISFLIVSIIYRLPSIFFIICILMSLMVLIIKHNDFVIML